ncbi:MAG TPA: hypothetical protein VGD99_09945 [Anaerolineae bacterium]
MTQDEGNRIEIEQKQQLLDRHRRNRSYLEQQAAQYGLEVPLALYNALQAEAETISRLERELAALGVSAQSRPSWQALIIDADAHWRDIVISNVGQLGGTVIEVVEFSILTQREIIESCAMAIVSASGHVLVEPSTPKWIEEMVELGRCLPIVLLASWDDRDISIALRQACLNHAEDITVTTIFKETLDLHWFSRIIHQLLIR